ncbi:PepSY domain-containing protein [Blautia sp.]|uniref:PepSY domain-containing protein n=1 Tax=Blautia sp. TaxID=1955243 RepID=UPI002E77AB23|nr:PepSY domain-containing protein [Blautia sp.]MEE0811212.1 PepSY domain-containing protein [Blautia sp.]
MKKYMVLTMLAVTLGGALTGCGAGKDIGQEEAEKIAFQDAGIQETDTSRLRVSREQDDGRKSYEIEFDAGNKEYSYEIQASDGTILSSDVETIQQNIQTENQQAAQNPQTAATQQPAENQQTTEAPASQTPTPAVSEADAKKAALDRVPGAAEQDLRMELEYDDGRYIYEGDIYYQQKEYEFEIDANNGSFLKWSEERD